MNLSFLVLCAGFALQNQEINLVSKDPVSNQANSYSLDPSISADGRFICYTSAASNLIFSDSNQLRDVFLFEYDRNQSRLISQGLAGRPASGASHSARISADGSTVVFVSEASNLVKGDRNKCADIFIHDLRRGLTERITPPGSEANGDSSQPCLSGSGRFIAFTSEASNWVSGDVNNCADVFLYDRLLKTTHCISVNSKSTPANGASHSPTIARDRTKVAFVTTAPDLGAYADLPQVVISSGWHYLPKPVSQTSMGLPAAGACSQPSLSADGKWLAFVSTATNLIPGDRNPQPSIYLCHTPSGQLQLPVVDGKGRDVSAPARSPVLSEDGRFLAFTTLSAKLTAKDKNGQPDVFRLDRSRSKIDWVSKVPLKFLSAQRLGHGPTVQMSVQPSMTADGSVVAFASSSPWLVPADQNQSRDIFYWAKPMALAVATPKPPARPPSGPKDTSLYPKLPNGVEITPAVARALAKYYNLPSFHYTPQPMAPPQFNN